MSQLNTSKNDAQPSQIYFDLQSTNVISSTTEPVPFYFNEQRTNPYLQNPEDYYLSIIRFTVDSGTLPVFIPTILSGNNTNVNETIYRVTLSYIDAVEGTIEVSQPIIWEPQDSSARIPPPPSETATGTQDNSTGYYNCYSYQYWCYIVWKALKSAFDQLTSDATALGVVLPTIYAPIIDWDSSSSRAVIYADVDGYDLSRLDDPIIVEPIRFFMNAPLYSLFSSFPARYLGYTAASQKSFLILLANVGNTNSTTIVPNGVVANQYNAITLYQEWSTTSSWTPITALVFTSNTLPINATQVSQPLIYKENQLVPTSSGGNSAIANIITDIVSDSGLYAPNLVYLPQAQYRYISLFGNQPLYNLDISIYARLKTGELVPFKLQSGGCVTMKIAFIKKDSILNK
jgi:hypothetical protein